MKVRPVLFLIVSLVFISVPLALFAQNTESLTITTYYPSPYGSYVELRAKRMAIGDDYISTANADWNAGSTATNKVPSDTDLIVQGNVGIGLINPATELDVFGTNPDVNGAANASVRVTSFYGTSPSGQYAGSFGGRAARGSKSSPAALQSGDAFALFGGTGWTGSNWSDNSRAYMRFDTEEAWSSTNQGARIQFSTTPAGGTATAAAMVIKGDGKVGIGTMTPDTMLHVTGASTGAIKIVDGNQANGKVLTSNANGVGTWQTSPSGVVKVKGMVSAAGAVAVGTGFTSSIVSTGWYNVTFDTALSATPIVLISGSNTDGGAGTVSTAVVAVNVSATGFNVKSTQGTNWYNNGFAFVVLEP